MVDEQEVDMYSWVYSFVACVLGMSADRAYTGGVVTFTSLMPSADMDPEQVIAKAQASHELNMPLSICVSNLEEVYEAMVKAGLPIIAGYSSVFAPDADSYHTLVHSPMDLLAADVMRKGKAKGVSFGSVPLKVVEGDFVDFEGEDKLSGSETHQQWVETMKKQYPYFAKEKVVIKQESWFVEFVNSMMAGGDSARRAFDDVKNHKDHASALGSYLA